MFNSVFVIFLLMVKISKGEIENSNTTVQSLLKLYEDSLIQSLAMEKGDKLMVAAWMQRYQVDQVEAAAKSRVEMRRHRDVSFKKNSVNTKWMGCLDIHGHNINSADVAFYDGETECLKKAHSIERKKKKSVDQVEKEVRNWRKGYKYLIYLCERDFLDDSEAIGTCLVEYMQKDSYFETLKSLLKLKSSELEQLTKFLSDGIEDLDQCLSENLSFFLERDRNIMKSLDRCYKGNKEN